MRGRVRAALEFLRKQPGVDPERLGAIGYCFGGTCALELARSGADLDGVVSFHGGLNHQAGMQAQKLVARVLACHGADDPYVPPAEVAAFQNEMREAGADWQFISYGGAVHSFTNPKAGGDVSRGAAYNAPADVRSWEHMLRFFEETFGR